MHCWDSSVLAGKASPCWVQQPSNVTTLGCCPRCCMMPNSLRRSPRSLVPAPSFTPFTATNTVGPPPPPLLLPDPLSQAQRSRASAFHTCRMKEIRVSSMCGWVGPFWLIALSLTLQLTYYLWVLISLMNHSLIMERYFWTCAAI